MQKIQAEGYGDMVIQRLQGLRRNMELCDFKVSADGRVFEVPSFLPVSQFSASSLCITIYSISFLLDFSFVWKIHYYNWNTVKLTVVTSNEIYI